MVKYGLLIEKINDTFKVVSKVKLLSKAGGFIAVYQKQTFIVDPVKPTFTQFQKKFLRAEYQEIYCVNVNKEGGQMVWNGAVQSVSASDLDQIMSTHILRELASGVNSGKEKLINALLGFMFGALLVSVILVFYYTNLIQTMQDEIMQKLLDNNISLPDFDL
jgi:hypothetical protein